MFSPKKARFHACAAQPKPLSGFEGRQFFDFTEVEYGTKLGGQLSYSPLQRVFKIVIDRLLFRAAAWRASPLRIGIADVDKTSPFAPHQRVSFVHNNRIHPTKVSGSAILIDMPERE